MSLNKKITISSNKIPMIYLQSISETDANNTYVSWLNDKAVNQYLELRFNSQTLASVVDTIRSTIASPCEHLFTIRLQDTGKHIGNIKVGGINAQHNIAHISLFIGDKLSWGKGIATQAIELISQYSFKHLQLRKLCAAAYDNNIASTKAFLKIGYIDDCIFTNHYILEGKPCNLVQVCMFQHQAGHLAEINVLTIP